MNEQPNTTAEAQGGRLLPEAPGSATALEPSANEKRFRSMQLLACVKIMQAMGIEPSDLSPCD